uniref:DUF4218 domain-containing protein n=1 Tax=Oryza meridionalis TaxID=40149 RepID=A0A0E0E3Z0_9ORYZ
MRRLRSGSRGTANSGRQSGADIMAISGGAASRPSKSGSGNGANNTAISAVAASRPSNSGSGRGNGANNSAISAVAASRPSNSGCGSSPSNTVISVGVASRPSASQEPTSGTNLDDDGFNPFGMSAAAYTCWPVFVIPLNLPPGIVMKQHNIFLSLIIPGPEYPGKDFNVFIEPLVDDLLHAWENGEEIRAQLNNLVPVPNGDGFEGYGQTHNWTHVPSLWRLPYFHKLLLSHNIDVMHNEKNVAEAAFNTCFDIPDKTKDNVKARLDQGELCNRPHLNMFQKPSGQWVKPRADFYLNRSQKKEILEWFQTLKFPDGYAANMRRGVNMRNMRINGLKSHDYHITMERLLPVMFHGYLANDVWAVLAELSFFYRKLCAKEIDPIEMANLKHQVPILLCKLEMLFPPGFFNPMQHLIVHLPHEAMMWGPVQYRWMFLVERGQKNLKRKVKNRARVEASIAEAYILDEVSHFTYIYFAEQVRTVHNPIPRYNVTIESNDCELSLFFNRGQSTSRAVPRHLTDEEWGAAMLYVLTNLPEVDDYVDLVDVTMNADLKQVAKGCHTRVNTYSTYDINGYRFRTDKHEKERPNAVTINSGVLTVGQGENNDTTEYYRFIKEIFELRFEGIRPLTLVLFNCHWFDPAQLRYTPNYGLVEVAHASVLQMYEPFVVAHQATQVYYIPYPCKSVPDLAKRWVVYKVQPIGKLAVPVDEDYDFVPNGDYVEYFQEDGLLGTFVVDLVQELQDISELRYTPNYGLVEVAHASVLQMYEPFVVAHQATQVYYIPYPCKSVPDLAKRWVVYKVQPIGKLAVPVDEDYDFVPNGDYVEYFQEDGLLGTFVVDLVQELQDISEVDGVIGLNNRDAEDIDNDKGLDVLNGSVIPDNNEDNSSDSTYEEDDDEPQLFDDYF